MGPTKKPGLGMALCPTCHISHTEADLTDRQRRGGRKAAAVRVCECVDVRVHVCWRECPHVHVCVGVCVH